MTDNDIIKAQADKIFLLERALKDKTAEIERLEDLTIYQKKEIKELKSKNEKAVSDILAVADIGVQERETAKAEAIKEVLLTLEAEAESSDKYIREYDDSEVQRAYNKALWKSYNLVKEMTEGGVDNA